MICFLVYFSTSDIKKSRHSGLPARIFDSMKKIGYSSMIMLLLVGSNYLISSVLKIYRFSYWSWRINLMNGWFYYLTSILIGSCFFSTFGDCCSSLTKLISNYRFFWFYLEIYSYLFVLASSVCIRWIN